MYNNFVEYCNKTRKDGDKMIKKNITKLMKELGFPPHIKGYEYIRSAIILVLEDPKKINMLTKVLYPSIAKIYDTTPSRVERAIRNAIEIAFERGNTEVIYELFGYTIRQDKGKPTNLEFIATIVDKIRLDNFDDDAKK